MAQSDNTQSIRILGITAQDTRMENGRVVGKHGDLFNNLAECFQLIGMARAKLPKRSTYHHKLLTIRRDYQEWYTAALMNIIAFEDRSRLAQRAIKDWENQYDLIFQLHTMFSLGKLPENSPYVLATDNTYRISEQYWPKWVPVKWGRDSWVRRETEVYQNAAFIFTWSEFARQSMIQDYGISPDKIVATGVGANFIKSQIDQKTYDSQTALFIGYEFERKGGKAILEAWEQVQKQLPKAKLIIVGPPKPNETLPAGVDWLGPVQDREKIWELYDQATVFVMPSLFEPWGLVFAEAMGMGLPCIGSNVGATPELVIDGETGLLVPPHGSDELAEALINILSNPELAQRLGHQAHALMKEQFTWGKMVDKMTPHLLRVAKSK